MVMRLIIEPIVRAALLEDLGRAGDITSDAIVPRAAQVEATIAARQPGIVAGLEAALLAFELVEPALRIERVREDGARVVRGDVVARIAGPARGVLAAGVEPGKPHVGRCDRDPRSGGRDRKVKGQDRLHSKDHARITQSGKGSSASRRRRQSPFRAR
jgi:hypothetical protein